MGEGNGGGLSITEGGWGCWDVGRETGLIRM
jgi:hypothetical protein